MTNPLYLSRAVWKKWYLYGCSYFGAERYGGGSYARTDLVPGITDDRVRERLVERLNYVQLGFVWRRRIRGNAMQQCKVVVISADSLIRDPDVCERLHAGGYDQRYKSLGRLFQQYQISGLARTDFHERHFKPDQKI